ncbi:hypothetical protein LOD99_4096 [Oopsacas minuta]|uniref:Uncharacterized protein n=1 Tax=Oopsacas minuta TaxID=111878 RepID=A0AAV7JWY9_9METZ|nr:hypothetical protein LOD99_4096 [Oopsacas minuta]
MKDAEREVLARRHATRQRDEFKKEVAAKLLDNTINMIQAKMSHLIVLSSQLNNLISSIQKAYFKDIFEELNSLPEDAVLSVEYYPATADVVNIFMLTDNIQNVNIMEDGDILANSTTKHIMLKLRDMIAHNIVLKEQITGEIRNGIPDMMRLSTDKISCRTFRFLPVNQQCWLLGRDEIDVLRIDASEVKMQEGSAYEVRTGVLFSSSTKTYTINWSKCKRELQKYGRDLTWPKPSKRMKGERLLIYSGRSIVTPVDRPEVLQN